MKEGRCNSLHERFDQLLLVQTEMARLGYFLNPVPKEHTEALVTGPLIQRLRSTIKKRGFDKAAAHVAITFSGFGGDERELHEIPEVRRYWQALDRALPELPALLAFLPIVGYNGPGLHLLFLGDVDAVMHYPQEGRYRAHVVQGTDLTVDAIRRIRQAGRTYHLSERRVHNLIERFKLGAGAQ